MKGAGSLNTAQLQEYLNSQFIAALEKVAGHPLAVGTTGAFAEDFRCAANQVNTVMKLNEAEPYIWDANDIPIPPVPFVAIGGDNTVPPNARMKLAVWGLNPMFGAGVLEEKTEAVGMNLRNPTHTYAQYAQYHVGITSFPQVLVSAITSNYYRYLWQVVAGCGVPQSSHPSRPARFFTWKDIVAVWCKKCRKLLDDLSKCRGDPIRMVSVSLPAVRNPSSRPSPELAASLPRHPIFTNCGCGIGSPRRYLGCGQGCGGSLTAIAGTAKVEVDIVWVGRRRKRICQFSSC